MVIKTEKAFKADSCSYNVHIFQADRLVDKEQKAKDDAMAKRVDIISRLAFPSVFIIFCIVFPSCVYSHQMKHL